jgi:3-methylcrotonyl-CoA carboxylase alpha subunit
MSFQIILDGEAHEIEIIHRRPHLKLLIDGREHVVEDPGLPGEGLAHAVIAGQRLNVARAQADGGQVVRCDGRTHMVTLLAEGEEADEGAALSDLRAPMPGTVVSLHAEPGQDDPLPFVFGVQTSSAHATWPTSLCFTTG